MVSKRPLCINFFEKYAADDSHDLEIHESFLSVLSVLMPGLEACPSANEEHHGGLFDLAAFDQYAVDRHSSCIGWEPLPLTTVNAKISNMVHLSEAQ